MNGSTSIFKDQSERGELYTRLRGRKKRKKRYGTHDRRGRILNRVSMDQRPVVVEKRSGIGDGEIDTITGNNHCGALVSLAERKSCLPLIARLPYKSAGEVKPAVIDMLSPLKAKVYSLAPDNGKELAEHQSWLKIWRPIFLRPSVCLMGTGTQ